MPKRRLIKGLEKNLSILSRSLITQSLSIQVEYLILIMTHFILSCEQSTQVVDWIEYAISML